MPKLARFSSVPTPAPCGDSTNLPDILMTSPNYLLKGYSADDRIVYGTADTIAQQQINARLDAVFANP